MIHLFATSAALDVVHVGGANVGLIQHLIEQHDLLPVGGIGGSFQPKSFVVRAHIHRGGVHSLGVFGALQVHDDDGITADAPLAWNSRGPVR